MGSTEPNVIIFKWRPKIDAYMTAKKINVYSLQGILNAKIFTLSQVLNN